ncbi:bifunctional folylpolyglutamate synthase/dihydrofolate synthase [archaeon]|jgi:dihydrofolate synthase / folylpolyglutamate synthase|nr:bifunctional folylpolyglutamate synthase/dihydrofolate synthase [archaeon]MBT4397251.1 bifunctional folylpolyglutamate synthase/dihydrofolate synthase [archaeon]MBT4440631.1 bifunctional folylpolyglutamate synthase/dihydrofolate synthase [archaeon]
MFNESVEYIYSLERNKGRYTLEHIEKFLSKIGNIQNEFKIIHVAGTNGKGSTCSMINQGLIEEGYKVGFFSSPHLVRFNERIRVNNEIISDEALDRMAEKIKELQKETGIDLSFFEAAFVIAMLYFKERNVDYVVLEVGLGGRLDATNTCIPIISVITSISMDHMHMLGDDIEKIANEKAGIIKENVKVITSAKGKALEVVEKKCYEKNANLVIIGNKFLDLGLKGDYQKENGSLAFTVLRELGVGEESIKKGLLNSRWRGRFEFVEDNVLVDCAHNVDGMRACVDSVKKMNKSVMLVFGVCETKNVEGMTDILKELDLKGVVVTKSKVSSAMEPSVLKSYFPDAVVKEDLKESLEYARQVPADLILVCGSIYLIGEIYP